MDVDSRSRLAKVVRLIKVTDVTKKNLLNILSKTDPNDFERLLIVVKFRGLFKRSSTPTYSFSLPQTLSSNFKLQLTFDFLRVIEADLFLSKNPNVIRI